MPVLKDQEIACRNWWATARLLSPMGPDDDMKLRSWSRIWSRRNTCGMDHSESAKHFICGLCFVQINIIHRGPFSESRLNFRALNGPKYKSSGLERILNKYFPGEPHLSTALTSVVIPAFDTKLQQPVFFSSWRVGVYCNAIFEFLPGLGPSSPCCLFFSPLKFIFFFEFLAW
jgi:hypothetical protein